MPDDTPYISHTPGDPITAEDWNSVQVQIKEDIRGQIGKAEDEIRHGVVDKATDADKFADKSEADWTTELDQRYAAKIHDHEGQSVYRRYIKRFSGEPGLDKVLLRHDLGRYPLVDVYELLPVNDAKFPNCKILFYYGHEDADPNDLWVKVIRDRVPLGLPFDEVLGQLGVAYEDDDVIEDVLNDMWDALARDPNDEINHCQTTWVDECCGERRTVAQLKAAGNWDDLYLALRPKKRGLVMTAGQKTAPAVEVAVTEVNYRTLLIETTGFTAASPPLDLMFLLRI